MLIEFIDLSYRNFLGAGNTPIKLQLNKSPTTIINGKNGSGKSTFLDALTFGLFGKSFRGINKNNLINTINGRDCVVEVNFNKGMDEYKIIRGIKPHIFEIYHNGKMLDQEAAVRDQQAFLEDRILETNFKAFTQVVILGSAAYIPFMQLSAGARRELIENLLDIGLFSNMYRVLKVHQSVWKDQMAAIDSKLESYELNLTSNKSFLEQVRNRTDSENAKRMDELMQIKNTLAELAKSRDQLSRKLSDRQEDYELRGGSLAVSEQLQKLQQTKAILKEKQAMLEEQIAFFQNNSSCSVCQQDITDGHRHDIGSDAESKLQKIQKELDSIQAQEADILVVKEELKLIDAEIKEIVSEIAGLDIRKQERLSRAKTIKEELDSSKKVDGSDEAVLVERVSEIQTRIAELENEKRELHEKKRVIDFSQKMLKDDGIKAKIIKQYIPIINSHVNKYLHMMNFNVKFTLDENFTESLKSRNRDEFTYMNFSMGERQRIDLALLFAWRDVAKMKNSMNCNLLIFDEVFDSSLDSAGADDLLQILSALDASTRVFVISHKNLLEDNFRSVITFEKVRDFSRMVGV